MKRYSLLLIIFLSSLWTSPASAHEKPRLLVLVLCSDHFPVYIELQKIWKSYMHLDPEHIEAYFLRANPHMPVDYAIEGDTIWSRTTEGWVPHSAGILNKTLLSMEAILPKLKNFDFVLRTNLSSFYIFPRLLKQLETLPRKRCWFGSRMGQDGTIASGCGYVLSTDLVELLVQHKPELYGRKDSEDDVLVGRFLERQGIPLIIHPRQDFITLDAWQSFKGKIPQDLFQFRVKTDDAKRLTDDIYIQKQLLDIFYPLR